MSDSPGSFVPSEVEGRTSDSVPAPLDFARDERNLAFAQPSRLRTLIGFDDAADERVADDVASPEANHRDARDAVQLADRRRQARGAGIGKVDLERIGA